MKKNRSKNNFCDSFILTINLSKHVTSISSKEIMKNGDKMMPISVFYVGCIKISILVGEPKNPFLGAGTSNLSF